MHEQSSDTLDLPNNSFYLTNSKIIFSFLWRHKHAVYFILIFTQYTSLLIVLNQGFYYAAKKDMLLLGKISCMINISELTCCSKKAEKSVR